jgi:hypothetical protein
MVDFLVSFIKILSHGRWNDTGGAGFVFEILKLFRNIDDGLVFVDVGLILLWEFAELMFLIGKSAGKFLFLKLGVC